MKLVHGEKSSTISAKRSPSQTFDMVLITPPNYVFVSKVNDILSKSALKQVKTATYMHRGGGCKNCCKFVFPLLQISFSAIDEIRIITNGFVLLDFNFSFL